MLRIAKVAAQNRTPKKEGESGNPMMSQENTRKHKKKPSIRRQKPERGVLHSKPPVSASRAAGYSESFARVDVYRTLENPSIFAEKFPAGT